MISLFQLFKTLCFQAPAGMSIPMAIDDLMARDMARVINDTGFDCTVTPWKEVDPGKLPTGEVLAGNFKKGSYGYKCKLVGYLYKSSAEIICTDDDGAELGGITHYIDLTPYDL